MIDIHNHNDLPRTSQRWQSRFSEGDFTQKRNGELDGSGVIGHTITFCPEILNIAEDLITCVGIERGNSLVFDVL